MKRYLAVLLTVLMLLTGAAAETDGRQKDYLQAWHLALSGSYRQAGLVFDQLGDYEDSEQLAYLLGVSAYAESMTLIGDNVLAYEFHEQWGLINLNTCFLTQPIWDSVDKLNSDGLAKVRLNGRYGCINAQGETVIACEWDDISSFADGLCTVETNGRYGMMNAAGKLLTPAQWRMLGRSQSKLYAPSFVDGRMVVQNQSIKYGIMDREGNILGKVCWDSVPDLSQELPMVMRDNRYGFIDRDGNVVIEPQYRKAMAFSEGLAAVSADGQLLQFIDRDNNVIVPPVYENVQAFRGGVAHVKQPGMSWQVIDKTGQLVYFVTEQIRADYDAAVEKMAAEDYAGAVILLSGTIGYKDSYDQLNEARRLVPLKAAYDEGSAYLAKEKYEEAIAAFDRASGYKDADAQKAAAQELLYQLAADLMTAEDYKGAATEFAKLGDYKDSAAQAEECNRLVPLKSRYDKAVKWLEEEKYADAISYFGKASGYKDADAQKDAACEIVYMKATALLAEENYMEAIPLFEMITEYKDSREHLQLAEETIASSFMVANIGQYGFVLNNEGYYESTNQKIPDSYAMCEVRFKSTTGAIYLECINYAEQMRDYALISSLDKTLSMASYADANNVRTSFKYKNSDDVQIIKIPVPDTEQHTICIKYRKDGSGNAGNDSFQFRIRFE
ncbi:MAG: WG repeat-containing protein [Clostridia bacterium]|nr:WG repeat-containing protein [Clostridia bacterium]